MYCILHVGGRTLTFEYITFSTYSIPIETSGLLQLDIFFVLTGSLLLFLGFFANFLKRKLWVADVVVATVLGIIIGYAVGNIVNTPFMQWTTK